MRTKNAFLTCLAALGALSPTAAWGQDAPPAAPAADAAPVAAPATPPEPAPAEAAAAPAAPNEPAPAPAEPAAAGPTPVPAWFRIDSDGLGVQLWAGATHPLGDGIGLATDMYVTGSVGEFDIGPAITAGPVLLTPMIGAAFGWGTKRLEAIVPQFYVVGGPDPIYLELWVQDFIYTQDPKNHDLYTRFFIDYKLSDYVAIGPQIEATFLLNNDRDTLGSLPVGGNVMLSNYGPGGYFFFFLGYETQEAAQTNGNKLAGRLSWVKNF